MALSRDQVEQHLRTLPGWRYDSQALAREFVFEGFPDVVAFVARLGFDAEAHDHHPDLDIRYRRVTVRWSTHSDGGVTDKDVAGARQADAIASRFPQRA